MTFRGTWFGALAVASLAAAAGCGGGGGGGGTTVAPIPAQASPSSSPPSALSVALSSTTTTSAHVSAGTAGATITFPEVPSANATITIAGYATLPAGVAPLSHKRADASQLTIVACVVFTSSASFTLPSIPSFSFSLPSVDTSDQYYIAYLTPGSASWSGAVLGPATITGTTLTFPALDQPVNIVANQPYVFVLYSLAMSPSPSSSASPTISPSASPTATPTTPPTIAPNTTWTFSGGSAIVTAVASFSPIPVTAPAANDVSASVLWAFPNAFVSGTFSVYTAMNGCCGASTSDATPWLPPDSAPIGGTPILYFLIQDNGTNFFDGWTPQITVNAVPGGQIAQLLSTSTGCEEDYFQVNPANGQWFWDREKGMTTQFPPGSTSITIQTSTTTGSMIEPVLEYDRQLIGAISCGANLQVPV